MEKMMQITIQKKIFMGVNHTTEHKTTENVPDNLYLTNST